MNISRTSRAANILEPSDKHYSYNILLFDKNTKALTATNSKQRPYSENLFTAICRQGRVILTNCGADPNTSYQIAAVNYPSTSQDGFSLSTPTIITAKEMTEIVCAKLTKGSPYIPKNRIPSTQNTNTHHTINIASFPSTVNYNSITFGQPNPLETEQTSGKGTQRMLFKTSILTCEGLGYEKNLYHQAGAWEAFACVSAAKQPAVVIAICNPDGMMHIAPFINKSLSPAIEPFQLLKPTNINSKDKQHTYICYTKDEIWTAYQQTLIANGITPTNLTLSTSIYPAIQDNNIIVAGCTKTIPPAPLYGIVTQFDKNLVENLIKRQGISNTNHSRLLTSNQNVHNAQIGKLAPNTLIDDMVNTTQYPLQTKPNSNTTVDKTIKILTGSLPAIALLILAIAGAIRFIYKKKNNTPHSYDLVQYICSPTTNNTPNYLQGATNGTEPLVKQDAWSSKTSIIPVFIMEAEVQECNKKLPNSSLDQSSHEHPSDDTHNLTWAQTIRSRWFTWSTSSPAQ